MLNKKLNLNVTNVLPSCMRTQSILTSSLLVPSRYCFCPPNTCVLQEVNTHQQSTQKLPLGSINSSLYCVSKKPKSATSSFTQHLSADKWQWAAIATPTPVIFG